jgi:DNA-binding NtrC family response regulator
MERILIVDDEQSMLEVLTIMLKREGYEVTAVSEGREAIDLLESKGSDVVITDLKMEPVDGLEVLKSVKKIDPETVVIVMTAHGSIENAVEAMKEGAFEYVAKPFKMEELRILVARGLEQREMRLENRALKQEIEGRYHIDNIVGSSRGMQQVFRLIEKVAPTDSTVLIYGESGTGKELVARSLHYNSHRRNYAFEPINCSALPETLLESELFGHVKGSFTGAHADKKGLFEAANKGTVFLDEIGTMGASMQMKLLRVLQEREIKRVGDTTVKNIDVRVIAATNEELSEKVKSGEFREDLYYRLNVIPITIPPLRERREDISVLVKHFLKMQQKKLKVEFKISDDTMAVLEGYDWPGNVREVENVIERAVTLCDGNVITPEDLPEALSAGHMISFRRDKKLRSVLLDSEYRHIMGILEDVNGDKKAAAKMLGISLPSLYRKLDYFKKVENTSSGLPAGKGTRSIAG